MADVGVCKVLYFSVDHVKLVYLCVTLYRRWNLVMYAHGTVQPCQTVRRSSNKSSFGVLPVAIWGQTNTILHEYIPATDVSSSLCVL